ncbi:replication factor A2 [Pancytospora epiphaga]|nr:replication factor A2 [Pancytospora epiphaga]
MDYYSDGGYQDYAPRQEYTGAKTLRAFSAKQIKNLPVDDSTSILRIDNSEISNVIIVGYVASSRTNSAGIVFTLFDTTAIIECTCWANSQQDEQTSEHIRDGNLLKVIGSIKTFNSKKSVSVSSVMPVSTKYLLYHLTNVIYQSLYYQHRIQIQQPARSSHSAGNKSVTGSAINDDVMETYRNNQDDNGLNLNLVISMLQGKYSEAQIREANENLLINCHIYSVDQNNYRTTL